MRTTQLHPMAIAETKKNNEALIKAASEEPTLKSMLAQRETALSNLRASHQKKVSEILERDYTSTPITAKMIEENNDFLKDYKTDNNALDDISQRKLNALLHQQKNHTMELTTILNNPSVEAKKYEQQLKREKVIEKYTAVNAGFDAITQLGVMTENKTLTTIGTLGTAGVSIAYNVALISGAIPGVALTGWGLILPGIGIAMTAATVIFTLCSKKSKGDNFQKYMIEGIRAIMQQLNYVHKSLQNQINLLEIKLLLEFLGVNNKILLQSALIKDMLQNGFSTINFKLDTIQADLNRLSTITKNGIAVNYLQEFDGTMSALEQYTEMNVNRSREIEPHLITLTTWLTNLSYFKNTNGAWCFPLDATYETAFSSAHLANHDNLLNTNLSHMLGYMGYLISAIPGVQFNNVSYALLPNIDLFLQGLKVYAGTRRHIGTVLARQLDPENDSLHKIQEIINNANRFFQQLHAQEQIIFLSLLNLYENKYIQFKEALVKGAKKVLADGVVTPYFEFPAEDQLATEKHISWPTSVRGLSFAPVLKLLKTQAKLTIPRFIHSALAGRIGAIVATVTPVITPAHRAYDDTQGKGRVVHWVNSRSVVCKIEVAYEHQGQRHALYTLTATVPSYQSESQLYIQKDHNPIGALYDQKAKRLNEELVDTFLSRVWPTAIMSQVTTNREMISDNLKMAIVDSVVNVSVIKNESGYRYDILKKVLATPEILNNLPREMQQIKKLMLRILCLTNTPINYHIEKLWGEKEIFSNSYVWYEGLAQEISELKSAIHNINFKEGLKYLRAKTRGRALDLRPTNPIINNLKLSQQIITFLEQTESLPYAANDESSVDLVAHDSMRENELRAKLATEQENNHKQGFQFGEELALPIIIAGLQEQKYYEAANKLRAFLTNSPPKNPENTSKDFYQGLTQAVSLQLMKFVGELFTAKENDAGLWLLNEGQARIRLAIQTNTIPLLQTNPALSSSASNEAAPIRHQPTLFGNSSASASNLQSPVYKVLAIN